MTSEMIAEFSDELLAIDAKFGARLAVGSVCRRRRINAADLGAGASGGGIIVRAKSGIIGMGLSNRLFLLYIFGSILSRCDRMKAFACEKSTEDNEIKVNFVIMMLMVICIENLIEIT